MEEGKKGSWQGIKQYFKDFKVLKETRREYWGLQIINMLDCLAYFAMHNIVVVVLSENFGFTDAQAGYVYMAFASLTTLLLIVTGIVTDSLGVKKALYAAMTILLLTRAGVLITAYMEDPVELKQETPLAILQDGDGVPIKEGVSELTITTRDGSIFPVELSGAVTIGDVISDINNALFNDGTVTASVARSGVNLQLVDHTEGKGKLIVGPFDPNSDSTAKALGLVGEAKDDTFLGKRIFTALNGVRIEQLNQGRGLSGESVLIITDGGGGTLTINDLWRFETLRQMIDYIQERAIAWEVAIEIGPNTHGNGLQIVDKSGVKEPNLIIRGGAAELLDIAADKGGAKVEGGNLLSNPLRNFLVILSLILMAPGMAMIQTVFQVGNRRFTTEKSQGAGFNLWYLFMNVGAAGGGFLIDIIYKTMGLPRFHIFTIGIITAALCIIATMIMVKRTEQLKSADQGEGIGTEEAPEEEGKGPFQIAKEVVTNSTFWRFFLFMLAILGVRSVFLYMGILHPKFWLRMIGDQASIGFLQALNPILIIIGLILFIPFLHRFKLYSMLVVGAMITSISLLVLAVPLPSGWNVVTFTYAGSIAFLVILTIGELIWSPRLSQFTAAIAPKGQEGTYLGMAMIPYFMAKTVVSGLSGHMIARWCPEFPEGEPILGERIASGVIPFWNSPYMMWLILGAVAFVGTCVAIFFRGFFTKGMKDSSDPKTVGT